MLAEQLLATCFAMFSMQQDMASSGNTTSTMPEIKSINWLFPLKSVTWKRSAKIARCRRTGIMERTLWKSEKNLPNIRMIQGGKGRGKDGRLFSGNMDWKMNWRNSKRFNYY